MTTDELRSRTMRAVRSKDTKPEMLVRQVAHAMGYRYSLHRKDLPGKPDLVFSSRRKVIFINGCFWHGHDCKRGARAPKENADYWQNKISRNRARDLKAVEMLTQLGWTSSTFWECELKDANALRDKLKAFLD